MCLILLALNAHPAYRLILAANRDEFFSRPTAPAAFWDDAPNLLAGRDLQNAGTWLGVTRSGRIAAITNFRDPRHQKQHAPSRGLLVSGFLTSAVSADEYLTYLRQEGAACNGFNLIFGEPGRLCFFSNRDNEPRNLAPGVHGLSNHLLDTPWPKVQRGMEAMSRIITGGKMLQPEDLFSILADRAIAPDESLPDTGVGIEVERFLSSLFIASPLYGTRSSTVVLIDHNCRVTFSERTFSSTQETVRTVTEEFSFIKTPASTF
jgi:uncharacterized protein with NRDE domain